jgi:hypothetical protein
LLDARTTFGALSPGRKRQTRVSFNAYVYDCYCEILTALVHPDITFICSDERKAWCLVVQAYIDKLETAKGKLRSVPK